MKRRLIICPLVTVAVLAAAATASAHAHVSPPVALAQESQVYTLAVPTEKEDNHTTQVELTVPQGFGVDSFFPSPGWKRTVQATGSGENTVINRVTWSGGKVPTEEDAAFSFLGSPSSSKTYTFQVRQTYADGSVVDWSGPESSDSPAPTVVAKSTLGGGSSSTLAVVALVVGALGVVLGGIALLAGGRRALA
ncbi:MAG: DUF1775 domain-containing protein [Gaiellaceae bacterium]